MTYSANPFKRSMTPRQISWVPALFGALAMMTAVPAAWAGQGTSTVLSVTPANPSSGAVISLQAVIQSASVNVPGGTVTFFDSFNGIVEPIGTVQVQSANGSPGIALLQAEVGGVGAHQFTATFNATAAYASSTSYPQPITFAGPYLSATTFSSTATAPYTFTGTVSAFGPSAPTGNVGFIDTTTNANLGTATLNSATLKSGFTPYTAYALSNMNNGSSGNTNQPAIGDFNGDGRADYVVPANGGTVNILLGKGDGTFTTGTAITTTTPFAPCSAVVGDFNGDGKQDIAVLSSQGTGSVNVYLGNGDGTFAAARNFPVAASTSQSRTLVVGDFNRDGIQDLAATNFGLAQVAIILGNGDGSFQAPLYNTVNSLPYNLAVGDINQDGLPDIAVSSDGSKYVSLLTGNGDGTFKTFTTAYVGSSQVGTVAVGDFNGDGWPDLVTSSGPDSSVYVLINKKTTVPSFATAVAYSVGTAPYYMTIGDFNRDGYLDVVTANNGNATVDVFQGSGSGTLGTPTAYGTGGNAYFANVGDLNGDDRVDLTAVTTTGFSVLLSGQSESASLANISVNGCNTQSVDAMYGGDSNYATSTSSALTFTPTVATTTLTLNVLPPNGASGAQVTLQAILSPYNYGSTTSNGEVVTFYNNGVLAGTGTLASGAATLNYTLSNASYSFTAKYLGDCSFKASNSSAVTGTPKQSSTITWATPAAISYGTGLSSTQLNASDTVTGGGTYVYTPAAGTILTPGTTTLSVVFTPTNTAYGQETATVQLKVNPAASIITWPTPSPISYGTPLSGFQLDAYANTGTVVVPLASLYNVYGIYSPGSTFNTGGFDGDGYAYSTTTVGSTINWNGLTFNIGPPNALDAVANVPSIPLPAGNFSYLYMLGAMVNNIGPNDNFTVNYTDGTSNTVTIQMSDWFQAMGWPGESAVNCDEDRNYAYGGTNVDSACIYGYSIALDSTKTVLSVVPPQTRNIVMVAMDLVPPNIPGTFVYTPQSGTVEPSGTNTLSVSFTPNSSFYQSATATVKLVVSPPPGPTVTTISWPTPTPINYGTALTSIQLDAVAEAVARPTPVSLSNGLTVIASANDGTPYNLGGFDGYGNTFSYNSLNSGLINYAGSTFTLGQPGVPDAITNGTVYTLTNPGNYATIYLLGAATITGQTNEPFVLTYNDSNGNTVDVVNMSSWRAPAGYAGETTVATTTYVDGQAGNETTVSAADLYGYQLPADPSRTLVSVTLPSTRSVVIMALGFGSNVPLAVPGTYTYNPVSGTVEPPGNDTLNVSFTPTNTTSYTSATGSTILVVNKANPVITWPTPAPVAVGTKLSATQLDATAATPAGATLAGTFVYSPASGTTESTPGTVTLKVTFTPSNTTDYNTVTDTVQLIVGNGSTTMVGAAAYVDCCFFAQPTPYTITMGGANGVTPTGTVAVALNGNLIGSGSLVTTTAPNAAATFLVSSGSFYPGNNTVSLLYSGDSHYSTSTGTATIVLRNTAITVNPSSTNQPTNSTIHYQFAQAGAINYNFNPQGASSTEFTDTKTGTCQSGTAEVAGFDCTFIVAYQPTLPGTRRGALQVNFVPSGSSQTEPTLNLFLSGVSSTAQIALSSATQSTLTTAVSQPQQVVFNPTDAVNQNVYVANSLASVIDTMPSGGGTLTQWNQANTTQLKYPSDLTFDAFDNLVMPDSDTAAVYSYSPSMMTSTTIGTGGIQLGVPTQARFDYGGYLYISDGGNSPQIVVVPEEAYQPAVLSLGSQSVSFPQALAVDNTGAYLYTGDGNTSQVLKVGLNGIGGSTTVTQFPIAPCDTTVTSCAFSYPAGFAFDPNGDMYVTDSGARVLKIPSTHISGNAATTQMPFTGLVTPTGITLDGAGDIFVSDVAGFVTKLSVNNGAMKLPSVGASLTTTVSNTGNLPLSISAITLQRGSNSSFTESDTCTSASVAPGGTCTITVKYATASKGFDTLTITSNAFSPTGVSIALSY